MFGVLSEKNIQQKPHLFIAYQLFLAQRLELMRHAQQPSSADPSRQLKSSPAYHEETLCNIRQEPDQTKELV